MVNPIAMRKRVVISVYLIIILFSIFPLVSAGVAAWIAKSHGCILNEGTPHPCMISGSDRGELLYSMGVMGWLAFIAFPVGFLAFIVFTIVVVVKRKKKAWDPNDFKQFKQ